MEKLNQIIEAALFSADNPLSLDKLLALFEPHEQPSARQVREVIAALQQQYQDRGVQLVQVASGYRFQAIVEVAPWVGRLWEEKPARYSRALLETLALIAYRQPITRAEIEDVRGVSVSSSIIKTLLEREWVRSVGYKDVPGRPTLYATTKSFLDYFGLSSLDQLPPLAALRDLDEIQADLLAQVAEQEQQAPAVEAEDDSYGG